MTNIKPIGRPATENRESPVSFTYNDNLKAVGDGYSIILPDGFKVEEGADGRDFVAYIPNESDSDSFLASEFVIYAGSRQKNEVFAAFRIAEEYSAVSEALGKAWKAYGATFKTDEVRLLEYGRRDLPGAIVYLYDTSLKCLHAFAGLGIDNYIQNLRVQISQVSREDLAAYEEIVKTLIDHMTADKPAQLLKELDSPEFVSMNTTDGRMDEWIECLDEYVSHIALLRVLELNAVTEALKSQQAAGTTDIAKIRKDVKDMLRHVSEVTEQKLIKAEAVYTLKRAQYPGAANLTDMEKSLRSLIEQANQEITVDEELISVSSDYAKRVSKRLRSPALKAIDMLLSDDHAGRLSDELKDELINAKQKFSATAKVTSEKRSAEESPRVEEKAEPENKRQKKTEKQNKSAEENSSSKDGYVVRNGVLTGYKGKKYNLILPEGIKEIGDAAFAGVSIGSVVIPEGVTSIGAGAFEQCRGLHDIYIPETVTSIGYNAFYISYHLLTVHTIIGSPAEAIVRDIQRNLDWTCGQKIKNIADYDKSSWPTSDSDETDTAVKADLEDVLSKISILEKKKEEFQNLGFFARLSASDLKQRIMDLEQELRGITIKLGNYKNKNIEWDILDFQENKVLLISRYSLERKPFNKGMGDSSWENCTLRKWLNNDFIKTAFTEGEIARIEESYVRAEKNPEHKYPDPGNSTEDRLFLLSANEVKKYYETESSRVCAPTAYLQKQGETGRLESGERCCRWWLRTPGQTTYDAACISHDGRILYDGFSKYFDDMITVRPAMWIKLDE